MKLFLVKHWKWILLIFLLYEICGALLPFVFYPQIGETFASSFQPSSFYGEESPDRARIVETSQDALDTRIEMISQAQERIVLSTFDIREGSSFRDIFSCLLEAADRGVDVKILVDGLYGLVHMHGNPALYAVGSHPNVEIRFYNIPSLIRPWTFNGRMHDKYLLIDNQLLLLGGRNTFDYFLGNYNKKNLSYDRDVLIYNTDYSASSPLKSSVLGQIEDYFHTVWDSKDCRTVFENPPFWLKDKEAEEEAALMAHYETLTITKPQLTASGKDYTKETVPTGKVTLISNPIHIWAKEPWVWYQLQYMMAHASDRVLIQTPYAVFNQTMYDGMTEAASQVPTTMLVNSTAVGDNFMASSDYTRNRNKILDTGIEVMEFFGDHSSHGKSIVIDHRLSVIGSYNLDLRSTYVDTELMLVIDSPQLNRQLTDYILDMAESSLRVLPDGTYEENPRIQPIALTKQKEILFAVTSRLFQLIRYLI